MPFDARPLVLAFAALALAGCASAAPPAKAPPPRQEAVPTQILAPRVAGSVRELLAQGEHALAEQQWQVAADAFSAILAAGDGELEPALRPLVRLDLATAEEGLDHRARARDLCHEVARLWPASREARLALLRATSLHVSLEEWKELGETGDALLWRSDLDAVEKLTALGARGLSRIELGDEPGATRDVQDGVDIIEQLHYGEGGRLPPGAAQVRFALGEIRRYRSEQVRFTDVEAQVYAPGTTDKRAQAVPPDFLSRLEARCQLLLDAQSAFADAMRATDPRWTAMAGYRVGEMYRKLHHDLMVIPPTLLAKTDKQRQIFYAIMHVRYRVLLEKADDMMGRTLALTPQSDTAAWVTRAQETRAGIQQALEEEKAILKTFPFTEEEVQGAIEIMKKKAEAKRIADEKAAERRAPKPR